MNHFQKMRGLDQPLISEGEISFCSYDDMIQKLYLQELSRFLKFSSQVNV